jgi:hypothetical protein
MGFEMSNDGGAAGSTGGGNGGSGVNAYGAAPPPAPPGRLSAPNALGGQAQPVKLTDSGNAAALVTPAALSSSLESGSSSNYARIYVTDSTTGAIAHTSRLGAVPSSASPAEPDGLTNPGSLGYLASAGTGVAPVARTDTLFNGEAGIYEYTTGNRYSGVLGDLGVKVGNDLILVAGANDTSADGTRGDLDLSSGGETRINAVGAISIFSSDEITLDAVGDVNIKTSGTVTKTIGGHSYDDIEENSYRYVRGDEFFINIGNITKTVHGNSTSTLYGSSSNNYSGEVNNYFAGAKTQTNIGLQVNTSFGAILDFVGGFKHSFYYGLTIYNFLAFSYSNYFLGRTTTIYGTEVKIVNGVDVKKAAFKCEASAIDLSENGINNENAQVKAQRLSLMAKMGIYDAEISALQKLLM